MSFNVVRIENYNPSNFMNTFDTPYKILPHNKSQREKDQKYFHNGSIVTWDGKFVRCPHKKSKKYCKDCSGSKVCPHGRRKVYCKECGGGGYCQHGRQSSRCKNCGGASICIHGRRKQICIDCGGTQICCHQKIKYDCQECYILSKIKKTN